jgi:molybdopterin biosynthesis enzyme
MGLRPEVRTTLTARLEHALSSPPGRAQVARAVATHTEQGWRADPVWGQASHFVADLARANAFVFVPPDVTRVEAGEAVEIWLLDDPGAG